MYNDLDIALLEQLCPWYRKILDYQEICRTEQACFNALAEEIRAIADNFFFQTMDESAIAQWEDVFYIIPDLARETLEFRRKRVLNRISLKTPYTLGFLYQRLDELIGEGLWNVTVDYPNYTLYIESSAENQLYASEVMITVGKIKPAHIVYVNTPVIEAGLLLSETGERVGKLVYHYHPGAWKLGELPFATEEDKELIKMPAIPSIHPAAAAEAYGKFRQVRRRQRKSQRQYPSCAVFQVRHRLHVDGRILVLACAGRYRYPGGAAGRGRDRADKQQCVRPCVRYDPHQACDSRAGRSGGR